MSESDSEPYNHEKDDINRNKLVIGEGKKKKRKSSLKKPKKRKKRVTIVNNAPHSDYTNIPNPKQTRRKKSTFDAQELHQLKDQMMRQKYAQSVKSALQASQVPPEVAAAQQAQRQLIAAQNAPLAHETDVAKRLQLDRMDKVVKQLKVQKKTLEAMGRTLPRGTDDILRKYTQMIRQALLRYPDEPAEAVEDIRNIGDNMHEEMEDLQMRHAEAEMEGDEPPSRRQVVHGKGLILNAPQQTVSYDKTVQQAPTRRSAQMGQYLTSSSMAPRQYLLKSTGSGAMDDAIEIVGRGLSGELISGGEGVFESVLKGIGTWLLNRGKTAYRDRKEELWREKHYPKKSGGTSIPQRDRRTQEEIAKEFMDNLMRNQNRLTPKPRGGLKIHGLYCGPNWTSGKVLAAKDAVDSDWSVQPIDDLDAACKTHDFQCGKVGPEGCSKAGTPWKRAKALAVASAIKASSYTRGHGSVDGGFLPWIKMASQWTDAPVWNYVAKPLLKELLPKRGKGKWNPPKSPSGRKKMLDKFGDECFLEPNKLKYPICDPQGKVSKKGVNAAIFRAAQSHNTKVEAKARAIKSKLGEGSKAERDYARKQGVSPELLHWIGDGKLNLKQKIRDKVKEKMREEVPKPLRWMGLEKTGLAKSKAKSKIRSKLPKVLQDKGIAEYLVGDGGLRSVHKKDNRPFSSKLGCALNPGWLPCRF